MLVDFWATWCIPCVEKLPYIEALHQKYNDRGFVVIAMHTAKNAEKLDTYLTEHGVSIPVALDTGETARRYGVRGIPAYFLIGKDGKLASGLLYAPPTEAEIEVLLQ